MLAKTLRLGVSSSMYDVKSDESGQYEMTKPAIEAPKVSNCGAVAVEGSAGELDTRCFPLTPKAMMYTMSTGIHATLS